MTAISGDVSHFDLCNIFFTSTSMCLVHFKFKKMNFSRRTPTLNSHYWLRCANQLKVHQKRMNLSVFLPLGSMLLHIYRGKCPKPDPHFVFDFKNI
jgi:hypothetical protein